MNRYLFKKSTELIKVNFPALAHKDYRYFWLGQMVSLIGSWMQRMGQAWLVFTLTGSPLKLGIVGALQFLPVTFFSLFMGVFADKLSKKKILIVTQTVFMGLALLLSVLVLSGLVEYWHILIMAFLLGCTNAIDMPTRQAYIIELVGRKDIRNAVALNSAVFNLARIIGPALAGLVIAKFGVGWCFFINGASFIAALYGLNKITTVSHQNNNNSHNRIFTDIHEGLQYVLKTPLLFKTIAILFVMGVLVYNFDVLIPVLAKNNLHLDEKGFGFLLSSLGVGCLIGAISVSLRSKSEPKYRSMIIFSFLISLMLVLIGVSRTYYVTSFFLVICGLFNIWFSTSANSLMQLNSDDALRGRVMSVYTCVFMGATPLGNFIAGFIAEHFGADVAFIITGALITLIILLIHMKKRIPKQKFSL